MSITSTRRVRPWSKSFLMTWSGRGKTLCSSSSKQADKHMTLSGLTRRQGQHPCIRA